MRLTLGSQSFQSAGLPWLIVLAMMFLGFASRGRQRLTFHLAGIAVFVVVQFSGCGSGGTTGTPSPTNFRTPRGSYTISFTATGQGTATTTPLQLTVQ
jgi:hypothetical protein